MATNTVEIAASPNDVFDLMLDPRNCAYWVVGTKEIPSVDDGWPLRGSGFEARVGIGPLHIGARTTLIEAERPRAMTLDTMVGPVPATIELEISESPAGCTVEMREYVNDPLWRLMLGPGADVAFKIRNVESLNRLKALAERSGAVDAPSLRGTLTGIDIFGDPDVEEVLEGAKHAYLAVDARSGPHVTPELFAVHAGRLWLVTASATVKSKTIDRRSPVGVLLADGKRSVIVRGEALVLDPFMPFGWLEAFQESAQVAGAVLHYAGRNARDLLPTIRHFLSSIPKQGFQSRRVVVALRPERALLLDGHRVTASFGAWDEDGEVVPERSPRRTGAVDVSALPPDFQDVVEDRVSAVLAWETASGPMPLPAFWDAGSSLARIPQELVSAAALPSTSKVGLMLRADGKVADKAGVLLRGRAHLDPDGTASLDLERAAFWSDDLAASTDLR